MNTETLARINRETLLRLYKEQIVKETLPLEVAIQNFKNVVRLLDNSETLSLPRREQSDKN